MWHIYFLVYQATGHLGVMLLVAILASISMLFVFLRLKGNRILSGFVILLCVLATAVIWSPRPQLFSLVMFSILSYLIFDKGFSKSKKTFVMTISLFLMWSNLHAGFSAGILLLILSFFGLVFDLIFQNEFAQIVQQTFGIFVQEMNIQGSRFGFIINF